MGLVVRSVCVALLVGLFASSQAQATGASVSPYRGVLDSKTRIVTFNIKNPSNAPVEYKLELVDRVQREDGATVRSEDYLFSARDHLRMSPRKSVMLDPQEGKSVRIKVRNLGGLPDGEYRSYLKVTPVLSSAGGGIVMATSIEVPVIVRKGDLTLDIDVEGHYKDGVLAYSFKRAGERSYFGDLKIEQGGTELYKASGFAIYPETVLLRKTVELPGDSRESFVVTLKEEGSSGSFEKQFVVNP